MPRMPPWAKARWIALALLVVLVAAPGRARAAARVEPALILDAPPARAGEAHDAAPRHFRTTAFPLDHGRGNAPAATGLARIRMSGSAQFNEAQFAAMLCQLPLPLLVVDLRQESHGFLNGLAVSWYAPRDWANRGLTAPLVQNDEQARLAGLLARGKVEVVESFAKSPDGAMLDPRTTLLACDLAATEAELALRQGVGYLRLAVTDHLAPNDADVDRFLGAYRTLGPEVWLHFHCHGGDGRTTTFMAMTDMLRNADRVSLADIIARQRQLGGLELIGAAPEGPDWKRAGYLARAAFLTRFYDFAKTGAPSGRSWSDWSRAHP